MAVSNLNEFTLVKNQIIKEALREIEACSADREPTSNDLINASTKLNMMTKSWENKSDYPWKRTEGSLFVNTSTNGYILDGSTAHATENFDQTTTTIIASSGASLITISSTIGFVVGYNIGVVQNDSTILWTTITAISGSDITLNTTLTDGVAIGNKIYVYQTKINKPQAIDSTRLSLTTSNLETSINSIDQLTYRNLSNKKTVGTPNQYYYEKLRSSGVLYLYQQPDSDSNYIINFTFQKPLFDFNNPTDDADFPIEWLSALVKNLAYELARGYGKSSEFSEILKRDADNLFEEAIGADKSNASIYFQPVNNENY